MKMLINSVIAFLLCSLSSSSLHAQSKFIEETENRYKSAQLEKPKEIDISYGTDGGADLKKYIKGNSSLIVVRIGLSNRNYVRSYLLDGKNLIFFSIRNEALPKEGASQDAERAFSEDRYYFRDGKIVAEVSSKSGSDDLKFKAAETEIQKIQEALSSSSSDSELIKLIQGGLFEVSK